MILRWPSYTATSVRLDVLNANAFPTVVAQLPQRAPQRGQVPRRRSIDLLPLLRRFQVATYRLEILDDCLRDPDTSLVSANSCAVIRERLRNGFDCSNDLFARHEQGRCLA